MFWFINFSFLFKLVKILSADRNCVRDISIDDDLMLLPGITNFGFKFIFLSKESIKDSILIIESLFMRSKSHLAWLSLWWFLLDTDISVLIKNKSFCISRIIEVIYLSLLSALDFPN